MVKAGPGPLFGERAEAGSQRVSLDIPTRRLNGKRLETPLINVTGTGGLVVGVPTLRVS